MLRISEGNFPKLSVDGVNLNTRNGSSSTYPPVFILSPTPRCGTNFLAQTLLLISTYQIPNFVWEAYILFYSQLLKQFVIRASNHWDKKVCGNEEYQKHMFRRLGDGILCFLGEHIEEGKQLLCKTPRAINIENFTHLFPQAKLLVLIRDGRDVVASAVKTWPNRILAFERSAFTWARGARSVQNFMEGENQCLRGKSWELVRYEDLVQQPLVAMRKVLHFLGIDEDAFDFEQMMKLGLRGSSVHRGGMDAVHWEPVEKPRNFQPIGRWKNWNLWQKTVFKLIAGKELICSGYVDSHNW